MLDGVTGESEMRMDQRWRIAIYGDILSSEHAKARVLIHIDTLVSFTLQRRTCIMIWILTSIVARSTC